MTARSTTVSLPLQAKEELYGFGLQFFRMKHRGQKRIIRVNADPRTDNGESHAPVPLYVSSKGYAVLVDTARYAAFYCGESKPRPAKPDTSAPAGTAPLYTDALRPEDTSRVLVDIPYAKGVEVYLFEGPSMLDAVRRYNMFSGGGVMPPEWGLGFWYRMESAATDKDVIALGNELRSRKIPCDVMGLEAGWHTHAYSCTFAWNPVRFPEPASFVRKMNDANFRVNLWEHAFTHPQSPLFAAMRPLSGDRGVWGGLVPDFHDPKARATFGGYHGKALVDIGISGFKLDECDNSDNTGGWSFGEASRFPSGIDGEQMHALFGLRYQKAIWDEYAKRKQETYGLVRSSGALASPYPFVLYSDLYDHREFIRALVTSGFSGLLWCPEVRDARNEEDLIRRLQSVVLSPLAMVNGWYIKNPPWKQIDKKKNNEGAFAAGWEQLEERCREIISWRMMLVPTLQAAFARYKREGTPPFRPLILDWPDDQELAGVDDAWMVGDRLLAAPLFAGESGRKLRLPEGRWFDFWTGKAYEGKSALEIPSTHKHIPLFVKDGSVLPLATVTGTTRDPLRRVLQVKVFGEGNVPFSMRLPDGSTLDCAWNTSTNSVDVRSHGFDVPFSLGKVERIHGA